MKVEIKSIAGSVLFQGDFSCLADAVKAAVKSSANLSYAYLRSANLSSADLRSANLSSADLSSADLRSANLSSANLSYADLRSANLSSANLSSADLSSADLRSANLSSANLSYADLRSANLRSANLSSADLSSADLRSANLSSANLSSAKNSKLAIAMTRILPDGDLIGWKKCREQIIAKVQIPAEAMRSHAFGRKCRAEFVKVLALSSGKEAISLHDADTVYVVGKTVKCDKWNDDFTVECGGGIHFYITEAEAKAHT